MAMFGTKAGTLTYSTELDKTGLKKGLNSAESDIKRSGSTIKDVFLGLQLDKIVSAAMHVISNSVGDAVTRFDTLNNFPKVMSNLGISASESEKAIKKMSDKLTGLPTTLDAGALAVQRFTSKNGDVSKSTDLFLALNNAILAGGASADIQSTALEQMAQAYAKGKPDMMEWRTLMTAMPAQLKQVATAMGYIDAEALGEDLRKGVVSMDDFMNTIVKLNKDGVGNFKSFEEQSKNAVEGVNTAIVNFKTQIVKGVTEAITQVNKGLKKANLGSLADIISKAGEIARESLIKVSKYIVPIIKATVNLIKYLKTLKPVIVSVVAAFVAYQVALKAIVAIDIARKILSTVSVFIKLIPLIKSAKDAMLLLNVAFGASPVGLVTVAIAALVGAITLFSQTSKQTNKELEEQTNKIKDNQKAWSDLQKEKQNEINVGMTEISHYQALYDELTNITDANGRVKAGYEERAKFIVSTLNDALGTEITMTDGVIQKYDGLKKAIDDVIEKKKAEIILSSQEGKYQEALTKQQEALETLNELEKSLADKQKERQKAEDELWEIITKPHWKWEEARAKEKLDNLEKETQKYQENYNKQKDLLSEYAYSIGQYENNMALAHQGKYSEMETVTWDYVKKYEEAGDAEKKLTEDRIKTTQANLDLLKELRRKSGTDIYDEQIKTSEKQLATLEEDLKKYTSVTDIELQNTKLVWSKNLDDQLSEITGRKVLFKEDAKGNIQAYIDGVKTGEPKSKKEMSKLVESTINEISKQKTGSETAGKDLVNGLNKGVGNKKAQNGVFKTISDFGSKLLAKLKNSLEEKSPSKATEEMGLNLDKGTEIGIKKGQNSVLKQVDKFGSSLLNKFKENIDASQMLSTIDELNNQIVDRMSNEIELQSGKVNANANLQSNYKLDNSIVVQGTIENNLALNGRKLGQETAPYVMKAIKNGGI